MIKAEDPVFWVNNDTKEVLVRPFDWGVPEDGGHQYWADPIGAAYMQWQKMNNGQRVRLMLETVIDLGMQGFPLATVLKEFATVEEFRALGSRSVSLVARYECVPLRDAMLGCIPTIFACKM
jgi:hypothetical protein